METEMETKRNRIAHAVVVCARVLLIAITCCRGKVIVIDEKRKGEEDRLNVSSQSV